MNKHLSSILLSSLLTASVSACTPKGFVSQPTFESGQYTFRDPVQAAENLRKAVEAQDKETLTKIFGPESAEILSSGDAATDSDIMKTFASRMEEEVDIIETTNPNPALKNQRLAFLLVGEQHYPFPIALYRRANGWRFDTAVGKEEIIDRRVGRNEIKTIGVTQRYVEAQHAYRALQEREGKPPQFARTFYSTPGTHDGLYWESAQGQPSSPIGVSVAAASRERGPHTTPRPLFGYHYAILKSQGPHARGGALSYIDAKGSMSRGFAIVAYPASYGRSGVATFLVGPDGVVYEKNLGPQTEKIAREIRMFDPDLSWTPVR
jgi:hypothetical protein